MAQLLGKSHVSSTWLLVIGEFLASRQLFASYLRMPWLLTSIIFKYMDIISRVLAWHITCNLIVTDGPCLLGHQVKKGEDSMYIQIANYNAYSYVCRYIAS